MNAPVQPLFVEQVLLLNYVKLPVVLHQGRQWVPVPLLAGLLEVSLEEVMTLVQNPSLAQGPSAMLPVEGFDGGAVACINRTDLPLILGWLGVNNEAAAWLWTAHLQDRLVRDTAASELHLIERERATSGLTSAGLH